MLRPVTRSQARHRVYRFGDFHLDLDRESLSRGGQALKLRPKSFAVLRYLVEHAGRLVSKEELLAEIWGHLHVSEGSLTQCLIDIRRVLADADHQMVRTVPRRGYIFELKVSASGSAPAKSNASRRLLPLRFSLSALAVLVLLVVGGVWGVRYVVRSAIGPMAVAHHAAPNAIATQPTQTLNPVPARPDDAGSAKVKYSPAYNHYQRGEFFWHRRAAGDMALAEREFRQATQADPGYAPAWTGLAGALWGRILNAGKAPAPGELEAYRDALEHAVAADPNLAEAHMRLANYYLVVENYPEFHAHWEKARALAPDDLLVLGWGAAFAAWHGHYQQAISLQRRAAEVAPLSAVVHANLAGFLMAGGRFKEAESEFRQVLELSPRMNSADPNFLSPASGLALAMILQKRYAQALAVIDKQPSDAPGNKQVEALAYWGMGRRAEYTKAVAQLEREGGPSTQLRLAELDAFRGHREDAFSHLRAAVDGVNDMNGPTAKWDLLQELRLSPFLIPLRDDPLWAQLTRLPDA